MIQCTNPDCLSENVTNLSFDSNEFICNDCGEDFIADNGIELEDENTDNEPSFIDLFSDVAMNIARQVIKDNNRREN